MSCLHSSSKSYCVCIDVVLSQVSLPLDVENVILCPSLIFVHVQQGEILLHSHQVQGKSFFFPPPKMKLHGDGEFQNGNYCLCAGAKATGKLNKQEFLFSAFLLCLKQLAAFSSSCNMRKRRVEYLHRWKRGKDAVEEDGKTKQLTAAMLLVKYPQVGLDCRMHTLIWLEAIQHRYKSKVQLTPCAHCPSLLRALSVNTQTFLL